MGDARLFLTNEQIETFIQRLGQPKASVVLQRFFRSYRSVLDSRDVAELYDKEYRRHLRSHDTFALVDGRFAVHVFSRYAYEYLLASSGRGRVLDIGCGDGEFLMALASSGFDCVGVDFSEAEIARATQKAAEAQLPVKFRCLDACELDDEESFNFVVMNDVTEHLSDRELARILEKCRSLLVSNGELLLHTPNGLSLPAESDWSLRLQLWKLALWLASGYCGFEKSASQLYYEQMHINVKSYRQLRRLLRVHGFRTSVQYDPRNSLLYRLCVGDAVLSSNMLVIASKIRRQ